MEVSNGIIFFAPLNTLPNANTLCTWNTEFACDSYLDWVPECALWSLWDLTLAGP